MTDESTIECVRIFLETVGLTDSRQGNAMTDLEILAAPISSFDIDSLDTMEFVMAIEDRFEILLNEESVNGCETLADFSKLVAEARDV